MITEGRTQAVWADCAFNPWLSDAPTLGKDMAVFGRDAECGDEALAHVWNQQARAFTSVFGGRRPRVFAGPRCQVLADEGRDLERARFWSLVRATPNLLWMVFLEDSVRALQALPSDWGAGYANVFVGAKATDASGLADVLDGLRDVPARLRFLITTPAVSMADDLDLDGLGWLIVTNGGSGVVPAFDWVASIKLQAMCYGIPVWIEPNPLLGLTCNGSVPLLALEQPRA